MLDWIKKALIAALIAIAWALLIKSAIETLLAPFPSPWPLIELIARMLPLAIIWAAAYAAYRGWIAFKALMRRAVMAVMPAASMGDNPNTRGRA